MGRGDSLFYKKVFSLLRRSESEVLAYRLVYEAVNASGRFPELASSLEAAKHAVRCAMEANTKQQLKNYPQHKVSRRSFCCWKPLTPRDRRTDARNVR